MVSDDGYSLLQFTLVIIYCLNIFNKWELNDLNLGCPRGDLDCECRSLNPCLWLGGSSYNLRNGWMRLPWSRWLGLFFPPLVGFLRCGSYQEHGKNLSHFPFQLLQWQMLFVQGDENGFIVHFILLMLSRGSWIWWVRRSLVVGLMLNACEWKSCCLKDETDVVVGI